MFPKPLFPKPLLMPLTKKTNHQREKRAGEEGDRDRRGPENRNITPLTPPGMRRVLQNRSLRNMPPHPSRQLKSPNRKKPL